MGHRMIHVCDGCSVEHEEQDPVMGGIGLGMMRGADSKTDTWGHLHVGVGRLPIGFDMCDDCVAKVIKLLGLHIPDEEEMAQRMGEYVGPFGPGMFGPGMGVPHIRRGSVARRRPGMRVVSGGLCACHDGYKCVPEACAGHCDKCLGRDGA